MPGKEKKIGERIRTLRKAQEMTLAELAEKSEISEETLYSIESHLVSPPLGNLVSLARVFGISMGDFFSDNGDASSCIVRKEERKKVARFNSTDGMGGGYNYESLGHHKKNRHMEPFLVTLKPTEGGPAEPNQHIGEEILFVLEGQVEVKLLDKTEILNPGDSIYYDSTMPHVVSCYGQEPATMLAVIYARNEMVIL